MNEYDNIHDAYLGTLADVFDNPDCVSSPRDQKVREKFNYSFTILNPKVEYIITKDAERNLVIADYSKKEFDLYESCSNKVDDFAKASKFWNKLANPDGTVNSAYGYLIWRYASCGGKFETEIVPDEAFQRQFSMENNTVKEVTGSVSRPIPKYRTPWEWCIQALIADKDTRQAVLRFSLPEHQWVGNKDQVCTLHGFFQIRNEKLDLTITMRSNDMTLGFAYDGIFFISLMYKMQDELKLAYPNLTIGRYTHFVHNIHVYDRDEEKVKKMLGRSI